MSISKTIARKIIFPAITAVGAEKMLASSKNNFMILMYHGVVKKTNLTLSANHLSADDFRKHLSYLKKNFNIVSLKEIFEQAGNNNKPSKKTIAITFDDGYENNFTNAFPILKEFQMPATIFVAAGCLVGKGHLLWYDKVDITKNKIDFTLFPKTEFNASPENKERLSKINSLSQLRDYLKSVNTWEKNMVLDKIIPEDVLQQSLLQTDKEFWQMLNANQLKEMSDSGLIEIGSHSVTHPNLDTLSDEELKTELMQSKKLLEDATGKPVTSIAYPDGAYNENVKRFSLQAGYKNILAVDYRLPNDASDKNILPRFCISNTTTTESNMIQIQMGFGKVGF